LVEVMRPQRQTLQIVTNRADVPVGGIALVAMPGEKLQSGKIVEKQKIGGEWSEAVLVDLAEPRPVQSQGLLNEQFEETISSLCAQCQDDQGPNSGHDKDGDIFELDAYQVLPRAALSIRRDGDDVSPGALHYVSGDAAIASFGKSKKIIAQICNDKGRWGKGFVMAITDRWGKIPGKMYRRWHKAGKDSGFSLGAVQLVQLTPTLVLANMIGQSGIKKGSKGSPIRYEALDVALRSVAAHASIEKSSIHMPRIGVGLAGGEWSRVEETLQSIVQEHGIEVYVYDYSG